MTREALISELIDTFQDVLNFVDINEEKAKEIFSEQQLELVDEVWFCQEDIEEADTNRLEDWYNQLDEMHHMY